MEFSLPVFDVDLDVIRFSRIEGMGVAVHQSVIVDQKQGVEIFPSLSQQVSEFERVGIVRCRRGKNMLGSEVLTLLQFRLPVICLAVESNGVGEMEEVKVTVLIQGVKELTVKDIRSVGEGRGHGSCREHQGFFPAGEEAGLEYGAEAEAD